MTCHKLRLINLVLFAVSALAIAHGQMAAVIGFFAMGYVTRMIDEAKP